MLKKFLAALIVILIFFVGLQISSLLKDRLAAGVDYEKASKEFQYSEKAKARFQADLDYLAHPENFEKELKSRFHFELPNEKVLILVPSKTSTSSTSTAVN